MRNLTEGLVEMCNTEELYYIDDRMKDFDDVETFLLVEILRMEDNGSTCRIFVKKDIFIEMKHKLSIPDVKFKSVFKELNDSESCIPKKCRSEDHYIAYYLLDEEGSSFKEPQIKVLQETCSMCFDTNKPTKHVRKYFIASRYRSNPVNVRVIMDEDNIALLNREQYANTAEE
jgi:hypothetical protein